MSTATSSVVEDGRPVIPWGDPSGPDARPLAPSMPAIRGLPQRTTDMTWMCLDIGERRIGVALSDPGEMIAQPHTTLRVPASGKLPLDEIRRLVQDRGVDGFVVGLPRRLDGTEGTAAAAVRERAVPLESLDLPVVWWDERLSTVEAERMLVEAGVRRRRRREVTDRVAAAVILQGFLDHRRLEKTR